MRNHLREGGRGEERREEGRDGRKEEEMKVERNEVSQKDEGKGEERRKEGKKGTRGTMRNLSEILLETRTVTLAHHVSTDALAGAKWSLQQHIYH